MSISLKFTLASKYLYKHKEMFEAILLDNNIY